MAHDSHVVAFHEAGHAVFVAASPWAQKLDLVQITPDNPEEGGRTVLSNHTGTCPPDEKALEFAKGLAGPLSQVCFSDHTIRDPYRVLFRDTILAAIEGVETLNAANVPGWLGDVRHYLEMLFAKWPSAIRQRFLDEMITIETNLRVWIQRPKVRECICLVADALLAEKLISGDVVNGICSILSPEDMITNEGLLS